MREEAMTPTRRDAAGDDGRSPPGPRRPVVLTRRVLLTIGAAAFIEACSGPSTRPFIARAGPSGDPEIPGDSHQEPHRTPSPSPTSTPKPWKPPTVPKPVAGHCPVLNDVVQRPGG